MKFEQTTPDGRDCYFMIDGDVAAVAAEYKETLRSKIHSHGTRWVGSSFDNFMQTITTGDEGLVAASEKMLAEIEDQVPMSRGWRNVDDVVGAVPNVPSFLAGHPQCMRRRERTMRDNAPLCIYMDLTSSAGIRCDDVQKRGVALLALTRLLVEHRPVELWVGASLGTRRLSATTAWKIDTAPLDLARAAFHISATVMSRGFGYNLCQKVWGSPGSWPFNNYDRHCATAKGRLAQVFPGQEILYVPPILLGDELTRNPTEWVKRTMKEYVGDEG